MLFLLLDFFIISALPSYASLNCSQELTEESAQEFTSKVFGTMAPPPFILSKIPWVSQNIVVDPVKPRRGDTLNREIHLKVNQENRSQISTLWPFQKKFLRDLERSLKERTEIDINLLDLLPNFVQKTFGLLPEEVFDFPRGKKFRLTNCYNSTLNFDSQRPSMRLVGPTEFMYTVRRSYDIIPPGETLIPGDKIILWRPWSAPDIIFAGLPLGGPVHAATYIGGEFVFGKYSDHPGNGYHISTIEDSFSTYFRDGLGYRRDADHWIAIRKKPRKNTK